VQHGRHDLPWRATRDPWAVLTSEVMLQQTQVARVLEAWPRFMQQFPDAEACARTGAGAVITAWGRLGYPRRARRLWEAAVVIAGDGWPADLTTLPGVGRYTAAALTAQAHDTDVPAIEVNIRRVTERFVGARLGDGAAEEHSVAIDRTLHGRDRLLALMDLGATVCTPRQPDCPACPLVRRCATRGVRQDETRHRQAPFAGSFRERRGRVMAAVRAGDARVAGLDTEALASLVADRLAEVSGSIARLPSS
jgi:A/G-specific adenine glycosylase